MNGKALRYPPSAGKGVPFAEASGLTDKKHACHTCFVAHAPYDLWGKRVEHSILMMLRFDGSFGFPGGWVDPGESLTVAAAREVSSDRSDIRVDVRSNVRSNVLMVGAGAGRDWRTSRDHRSGPLLQRGTHTCRKTARVHMAKVDACTHPLMHSWVFACVHACLHACNESVHAICTRMRDVEHSIECSTECSNRMFHRTYSGDTCRTLP